MQPIALSSHGVSLGSGVGKGCFAEAALRSGFVAPFFGGLDSGSGLTDSGSGGDGFGERWRGSWDWRLESWGR